MSAPSSQLNWISVNYTGTLFLRQCFYNTLVILPWLTDFGYHLSKLRRR